MLKLIHKKDYSDGSADYSYEADKAFYEFYKKETGQTVIKDEEVNAFIVDMLEKALDAKDK